MLVNSLVLVTVFVLADVFDDGIGVLCSDGVFWDAAIRMLFRRDDNSSESTTRSCSSAIFSSFLSRAFRRVRISPPKERRRDGVGQDLHDRRVFQSLLQAVLDRHLLLSQLIVNILRSS